MINLRLGEVDKKVLIKIRTDVISFQNFYFDKLKDSSLRTCRIEIQELSNILTIENGIYIPSKNFGKFMNETRLNYHLAYGEKVNPTKFIFSLVGYDRLISCIVLNETCVTINDID